MATRSVNDSRAEPPLITGSLRFFCAAHVVERVKTFPCVRFFSEKKYIDAGGAGGIDAGRERGERANAGAFLICAL